MTEKFDEIPPSPELLRINARTCIRLLAGRILDGDMPRSQRLWSGGGVAVVFRRPRRPEGILEWYADPRFVVTPHGFEVSRVFEELWKAFRPLLDSVSRIEFFGRLANAVHSCGIESRREGGGESHPSRKDLLLAILYEAVLIERELEEGSFGFLMISSGNENRDDRRTIRERLQFFESLSEPENPTANENG
ncbi:MAG: hypothetical protein M1297_09280 [Nitrospirae bacterium]|nr:hypothetical protein [Nitrospirota bacterium]